MTTATEGNRIILDFMGYEYIGWNDPKHRAIDYSSGYYGRKDVPLHSLKVTGSMLHNPLKYHSSFDWQIPVWRKVNLALKDAISKIVNEKPGLYHTEVNALFRRVCNDYNDAVFQNDCNKGQQILVSAIQWLNNKNKEA